MVKKRYLATKCRVTFELPERIAQCAESANLVGDFNDWDTHATQMEHNKGDMFAVTLDLEPNREYQYRYLVNGQDWYNDWDADKYVPNPIFGDNSVASTYQPEKTKTETKKRKAVKQ